MSSSESHTQYLHKNTDEKTRIRAWERKNEIHHLAFYESFDFNDILDENISLNNSDSDGSLSIHTPSRSIDANWWIDCRSPKSRRKFATKTSYNLKRM